MEIHLARNLFYPIILPQLMRSSKQFNYRGRPILYLCTHIINVKYLRQQDFNKIV